MRRRQLLTACGTALSALAGCGSPRSDGRSPTRNGTADSTPGGAVSSTPGGTLDVQLDALQPAVVQLFVDAYEFDAAAGSQYLFLAGPEATGADRRFRFDGTEYTPGVETSYDLVRAPSTFGEPTGASEWAVFELPETGDAADAALLAPDGEWRPGDALRSRLAASLPSLAVTSFEAPSSVAAGDRPTFTVTVENTSDTDGRFVGILRPPEGALSTGQLVSRTVDAGATVTLDATGEAVETPTPGTGGEDGDTLEYELTRPDSTTTTSLSVQ